MKKLLIRIALIGILVVGGSLYAFAGDTYPQSGGGDFIITDVSTISVTGLNGLNISTYTTVLAIDSPKYGRLALEKIILTNGTTEAYRVDVYDWTIATTTTVIVSVNLSPTTTTGSTFETTWPLTNMPRIDNILIRKTGTRSGFTEISVDGTVTFYGLWR